MSCRKPTKPADLLGDDLASDMEELHGPCAALLINGEPVVTQAEFRLLLPMWGVDLDQPDSTIVTLNGCSVPPERWHSGRVHSGDHLNILPKPR